MEPCAVDCLHAFRPGASGIFAGTTVRSVWCLIGSAGTLYVLQDGAPVQCLVIAVLLHEETNVFTVTALQLQFS